MKGLFRVALTCSILLVGIGCESEATKAANKADWAAAEKKIEMEKQAKEQLVKAAADAKRKQFDALKNDFVSEMDQRSNLVTRRHKTYAKSFHQNGRGIVAEIIGGRISCYSVYNAGTYLFHFRFLVTIGSVEKEFGGTEQHDPASVGVAERVTLDEGESTELCQFIAESDSKTPVLVRLEGAKLHKDLALSPSHRKAITETWAFAQAMK